MERLTEKISNGTKPKTLRGLIRWFVTHNGIRKDVIIGEYNKLYDRLVEYEDLGITPEQVRQMDAEFTRASKELADYKKSVDQGRPSNRNISPPGWCLYLHRAGKRTRLQ